MAVTFEPRTTAFGDMIIVRGAYEAGDATIDLSSFFGPNNVQMFDMTPNVASHAAVSTTFTDATCDYTAGGTPDPTVAHDTNTDIERGMLVSGAGIAAGSSVEEVTSDTAFELNQDTSAGSAVSNGTLTFTHSIIGIVGVEGTNIFFNFKDAIIEDTFTLADATNIVTLLSGVVTTTGAKTAGTFMAMGRRG